MAGRIGRIFTVIGLLLISAAWLWWLYLYHSSGALNCLYMPGGACAAPDGTGHFLALPPYEPLVLWVGVAVALVGAAIRLTTRS
jgi:hypothetical protein